MSFLYGALIYLFTCTFYWWWSSNLSFFGVSPNFVFAAVIAVSVMASPVRSMTYAFFFGLYMDMLSTSLFGAYALVYTLVSYAVHFMKRHFDLVSPFSQGIIALVMSPLAALAYGALSLAMAKINPFGLKALLLEPLLNALVLPFVFGALVAVRRKTGAP